MSIYIYNGTSWDECLDPSVYTSSGWVDIMEGHTYIGNNVWNRFFVRLTPVTPTVNNVSRTTNSLTFSYSHPGHSSGVYLVLKLVRVSDGATIAGPENTTLTSGSISANKTYTGLTNGVQYRFEAYAVYNAYNINSDTATTSYTTLTFIPVEPNLSFSSATVSSITVSATLPAQSPHYAQITVYRTTNAQGASLIPVSATTSLISGTKTETGLSVNTSYEFSAYTSYYDAPGGNFLAISDTVTETFSTLNYLLTTPTKPTNSDRQINSLKFKSSSNANYARNGSYYTANAYIEFTLYRTSNDAFVAIQTASLSNNDILTEKEVEFTGLSTGVEYYCRARTYYYSPVSAYSSYSTQSDDIKTLELVSFSTPLIPASNTTYLNNRLLVAESEATGFPASWASDGSTSTVWYSSPTVSGSSTVPIDTIERTPSRVRYISNSSATVGSATTVSTSVPGLRLEQYGVQRYTYNTTASPTGRRTDLISVSSTNFVFQPGTAVQISSPSPVPGIPGARTVVDRKNDYRLVFNTPTAAPLTPADTPYPSTISGPRPGLAISAEPVASYSVPGFGGTTVEVSSSNVPSTPTFSLANVTTSATMTISGTVSKSISYGDGYEDLDIYIVPKSGTYDNPRLVAGTNTVRISVPALNSAMTVRLYTTNSSGTLQDQGSTNISSGSYTFNLLQSSFPYYDAFMGADTIRIRLRCTRTNLPSAGGNVSAISDVVFNYRYDTYQ